MAIDKNIESFCDIALQLNMKVSDINLETIIRLMGWNLNDLIICCQKNEIERLRVLDNLHINLEMFYEKLCQLYYGDKLLMIRDFIENPSLKLLRKMPILKALGNDIYEKYEESLNDDFAKYIKLRGIILSSKKWKDRLEKMLSPISDNDIKEGNINHFPVHSILLLAFEKSFIDNKCPYWPFMTAIVPSPIVRADPEYPLTTPTDVVKINAIGSIILNLDERFKFYCKAAQIFMNQSEDSIKNWLMKVCSQNQEYDKQIKEEYKKKKKYDWSSLNQRTIIQ